MFATISGREEYTDPGEKFENVTMMLFQPVTQSDSPPWARYFDAKDRREMSEQDYFLLLRTIYNYRNPHAIIGEDGAVTDEEE